jgi:hypothetical protein
MTSFPSKPKKIQRDRLEGETMTVVRKWLDLEGETATGFEPIQWNGTGKANPD